MHKVFLVDDEPFILEGLRAIIKWQEYGLEITGQALNGLDAFNQIRDSDIDILITDITMPKMNGLQLIHTLKDTHPSIKFIVLSGYNEFEYVKEGIKLGIENYLLKPVNVQELISTMKNTTKKIQSTSSKELSLVKKDFTILKDNILYRWVTRTIDIEELKERSKILDINLECARYAVAIIRILPPPGEAGQRVPMEKPQLIAEAYSLCCKTLEQYDSAVCCNDFEGNIIAIFSECPAIISKPAIHAILKEIRNRMQSRLGVNLFITVGDYQYAFSEVYKSYSIAQKLQEYRLLSNTGRTIDFDEILQDKTTGQPLPELDYDLLSKQILSRNKQEVSAFIDTIFDKLQDCNGVTPSDIHNYSIELILHINKTVKNFEFNCNLSRSDYKKLFADMLELETISQLKAYIKAIADNAIDCFISEDTRVSPVIREVMRYISEHYAEEFSLKTLGCTFNINASYLGQLFLKEIGEHFSDYLNKYKIEKAKQLLLNTNLKAAEIAKKVGFSDTAYFYRQFKRYVGVTPVELRNFKATN